MIKREISPALIIREARAKKPSALFSLAEIQFLFQQPDLCALDKLIWFALATTCNNATLSCALSCVQLAQFVGANPISVICALVHLESLGFLQGPVTDLQPLAQQHKRLSNTPMSVLKEVVSPIAKKIPPSDVKAMRAYAKCERLVRHFTLSLPNKGLLSLKQQPPIKIGERSQITINLLKNNGLNRYFFKEVSNEE